VDIRIQRDQSPVASLEGDPRWLLAQRIVGSPGFVNSQRLSAFLLYVTRQSLTGKGDALNERLIGEAVFGRSPDYDPRDDNIVRSHASRLRTRLEEYFEREGAAESLRLQIPRGSYAPIFEEINSETAQPEVSNRVASPTVPNDDSPQRHLRLPLKLTLWAVAGLTLLVVIAIAAMKYRSNSAEQTPSHKLWSQMFSARQETLIVPADSSLVVARLLSGNQVPLAAYAGGRYRASPDCSKRCDQDLIHTVESLRYTSMSDLEFAVKITRLPEAIPDRTEIRYARDIELKDLKESNLILAGSQEADPWLEAISSEMSFVIHDDPSAGPLRVENKRPQKGEPSEYLYDSRDPQHRGLATISFLPNLGGTGSLLLVQGFSVAGTQAAAEYVTSRHDLDVLLRSYTGNSSALPHFEILLSTVEINGMATRAVPLALHIVP
jgi:hypothetical protein